MAKGRSFSAIRTPSLVRAYLSGAAFRGAEGEEEREAIEPGSGDYLASIHRHLDPARKFQQRFYYRLTPDFLGHPAWDNPMASIRAIYGIELVARPTVLRPTPVEEAARSAQ